MVLLRRRSFGRILIVRNDRLGDLLLTTPLATALREAFPLARLSWLASAYAAPLLKHNPDLDEVLVDDGAPVPELARRLGGGRFDVAVLASMNRRLAAATWRARIPVRVGPLSSAWGLLLTRPVRQRRARGTVHEADHNLQLLEALDLRVRRYPTRLELTPAERAGAAALVARLGCAPGRRPRVVLHAGGAGSAPRWPVPHYLELGRRLHERGACVIVSGELEEEGPPSPIPDGLVRLEPGRLSIRELAAVLASCQVVVSNSTGPLHMAVALGVPTVSFYPAVGTAQAHRWGPYPAFVESDPLHRVFIAPTTAGQPDMQAIAVDEVWHACEPHLVREPTP
jgi:heptosyltransferase-3